MATVNCVRITTIKKIPVLFESNKKNTFLANQTGRFATVLINPNKKVLTVSSATFRAIVKFMNHVNAFYAYKSR